MKALLGVAGLLGLIALAFGDKAASHVAKAITLALALAVIALIADVATHGMLSNGLRRY